jgi:apolipoprotein N-acyltransferase
MLAPRRGFAATRWGRAFLATLSGALLAAAFPPFDRAPLAWVAPAPLLFAVNGAGVRRAAGLGWVTGAVAMLGIGLFTTSFGGESLALRLLPLLLFAGIEALFYALAGAGLALVLRQGAPWRTLAGAPAVWLMAEFLRGWGPLGFPFGAIGYAMHGNRYLLQLASLGGHWLAGYVVVMGSAALFLLLSGQARRQAYIAVALIGLAHLAGAGMLSDASSIVRRGKDTGVVTAVQGGAAKNGDLDLEYLEFQRLLQRTAALEPPAGFRRGLIVWYESAPYGDLLNSPALHDDVAAAIRGAGRPLLTGTRSVDAGGRPGNFAALLAPDGRIVGTYRKRRPVPFGEWVPFRRFLPLAEAYGMPPQDDKAGSDWTVLLYAPFAVGAPICFESACPDVARAFVRRGANLLCVITNDSWFGRTGMMEQHRDVAVFRAVETRRWVVRCGRNGYTGFVSPWGEWSAVLPVGRGGATTQSVTLETGLTPSVRLGDWVPALCLLALLGLFIKPGPLNTPGR